MILRLEATDIGAGPATEGDLVVDDAVLVAPGDGSRAPGADPRHARWGAHTVIAGAQDSDRRARVVATASTSVVVVALGAAVGAMMHTVSASLVESTSATAMPAVTEQALPSALFVDTPGTTAEVLPPRRSPPAIAKMPVAASAGSGAPAFTTEQGTPAAAGHVVRGTHPHGAAERVAAFSAAAAAVNRGAYDEARAIFRRLLAADASDAPEAAALHFRIGNLYAREQRWLEARSSYEEAVGLDVRADYLFNLAVALEHLGRTTDALGRYRAALSAFEQHPASFAPQIAADRIAAIASQPETTP